MFYLHVQYYVLIVTEKSEGQMEVGSTKTLYSLLERSGNKSTALVTVSFLNPVHVMAGCYC